MKRGSPNFLDLREINDNELQKWPEVDKEDIEKGS